MITSIKNYVGKLTDQKIEHAAEKYGYENFIPYGLIKDLFCVWTYAVYNEPLKNAVEIDSEYDNSFLKLINAIRGSDIRHFNGLEFSFDVLKKYGSKLNLRNIEHSRFGKLPFDTDEEKIQFNYKVDIGDLPTEVLELVGIDMTDLPNTIELEDKIKDILGFFNDLKGLPGFQEAESKLIRQQMTKYTQVIKVSKKRLVYPSFKYNYAIKNLPVKIPIVERHDKSNLKLLVDVSMSAITNKRYVALYRAILVYLYSIFKDKLHVIDIYYYSFSINKILKIRNKRELTILYNSLLEGRPGLNGWDNSVEYFKKEFKSDTVIMLTDGKNDANQFNPGRNNIYHIVSLTQNFILKNLAKNTNGKFLNV